MVSGGSSNPKRCSVCKALNHRANECPSAVSTVSPRRNLPTRTTQGLTKLNRTHLCSICGKGGHRADTCMFRKQQPSMKRKYSALDRKTVYRESKGAPRTILKSLKEIKFDAIVRMSATQSKQLLVKNHLLPSRKRKRVCWNCGHTMRKTSRSMRCSSRACNTELRSPAVAHTPLWHHVKGGQAPPYNAFIRAMYTVGYKTPLDAAAGYIGCGRDSAQNWHRKIKHALAYAELSTGASAEYSGGTLEFDGTKSVINRSGKAKNVHCGRFVICYHRESDEYSLRPMPDASVPKGAPPPPEKYEHTLPIMNSKVKPHHMVATDSGQAWIKAGKNQRKQKGIAYTYVVHSRKQFTKLLRIPIDRLPPDMQAVAATITTTNSRFFRFRAGINLAEAAFGAIKRNMVRLNCQRHSGNAKINFLLSAWLQKHCGLHGVMEGIRIYQDYASVHVSPQLAFQDESWMEPETEVDDAVASRQK